MTFCPTEITKEVLPIYSFRIITKGESKVAFMQERRSCLMVLKVLVMEISSVANEGRVIYPTTHSIHDRVSKLRFVHQVSEGYG